jgi:hypothetical protein
MRHLLAVVAAELRAQRLALWAGLILGLTVAGVSVSLGGADDIAPFLAAAINISLGVAVGLGASILSRDLSERRLGFYLARPVPPLAYWGGKMSAALLLALAAGALCLLAPLVLGSVVGVAPGVPMWSATAKALAQGWVPWLAATSFLVAGGAVAGGAARARAPLLLLFDMMMLPLSIVLFLRSIGDSWRLGTTEIVIQHALWPAVLVATLVLLCAGAVQIGVGRLDLGRGHLWLSAIAWTGLLACIGAVTLYSRAVANASPGELRIPHGVSLHAPRSGSHVMLEGIAGRQSLRPGPFGGSRFYAGFLLGADGSVVKLAGLEGLTGFAWSKDARHFAWSKDSMNGAGSVAYSTPPLLREIPGFEPSLWVVSLDGPLARPRQVPREGQGQEAARALSPSGRRLLVSKAAGKALVDVETGDTLATVADPAEWSSLRFLSETLVRALRVGPSGQSRIVEWDAAGDRLNERGAIAAQSSTPNGARFFVTLTPTDDYERVLRYDASGLFLHDLEGRVTATLVNGWTTPYRVAGLVSGGRVACLESDAGGVRLRVFAADGRSLGDAQLPGRLLRVGGEAAPGLLALGLAPGRESDQRETAFVDLATGRVARREPGLLPGLRRWQAFQAPGPHILVRGDAALQDADQNPEPASLATRVFLSDEGVLLLDPATGEKRVIVRRRDRLED